MISLKGNTQCEYLRDAIAIAHFDN